MCFLHTYWNLKFMIRKSRPKICKGALAELRKAGDGDGGASACWRHRNNMKQLGKDHRQWRGYVWIYYYTIHIYIYIISSYELSKAQIYTSLHWPICSVGVPPSRNESPWRMVRPQRFDLGMPKHGQRWPAFWWAMLLGTPTAGTPRNGTPRNGTPRNGTPRKGGGTPRNGEARGFCFAHRTVLTWNNPST